MNLRGCLVLCGSALVVAGCGSAAAGSGAASTSSAAATPGAGRGGTFGQIVQVNPNALTVSTANGDVTVDYSSTTPITSSSTGTPGDIVEGTCVLIAGLKDATGMITASTVRLSQLVNGACVTASRPGGGFPGGGFPGGFSPRPTVAGATPRPTLNPNAAVVAGMVTAVSGTTVTVTATNGTVSSVTVPTTLTVTESSPGTASDIAVNGCVRAVGANNQGVVQATALTLQPTNSSGTCTAAGGGGFGGFGGFGGRPGGSPPTAG